jgi:hypothetical protein
MPYKDPEKARERKHIWRMENKDLIHEYNMRPESKLKNTITNTKRNIAFGPML